MRNFYTLFALLFFLKNSLSAENIFPENQYSTYFKKAYTLNPSIPKGALEAIAFTQTRFQHLTNEEGSCIGYPTTHGVMGLIENGKNYFRNNLITIAELSGLDIIEIEKNPETHILAYAKAFAELQKKFSVFGNKLNNYKKIFIALSELPLSNDLQNDFALNSHLYQLYWFLNNSEASQQYNFPKYTINFEEVFGENYKVLSSSTIKITDESKITNGYTDYKFASTASLFSADYPPALWDPAASCNYSSRNGTQISAVTIHFVQGSYAGCISWFKNCSANASAHYVVRSSDGQVTQMVLESNKAWHVGTENPYTVGIEHEGYISQISWFTNAMYNSSAALTKDICVSNNINTLRTYYGPSCSGSSSQCLLGSCTKVKGHQHNPNQTHTDPGQYWNWAKFYKLINNTYTVTTYTALSGNFYDTGGAAGNYTNDERKFWLFTNPSATNINLNFTSFNVEQGYDNLFIYNGGNHNSAMVGQYTGTINPGPVVVSNDSLLVEFRSDCGTVSSGWAATYTTVATTPTASDNIAPTTSVSTNNIWQTAAFTSTISDVDNIGGSGIEKGYYQVIDFNGTEWRANYTKGFFSDNFDNAIHPEWTIKTGTWSIATNALQQTDEISTAANNTNIYAALTQSLSNRYLYNFYAKFEGSGTNRRAGLHFFCDQPDSSNRNNSYFVWFRLDDQKIQIYKVLNNVFGSPAVDLPLSFNAGQWYDIKVIYDRITGKMSVYMNNILIATWTDPSPLTNGNYISFRSGNCKFSIDEIKVYRSRPSYVNVNVGTGFANELRYQNPSPIQFAGKIKSICQDSAGNLSPIDYYDLNIDWTPPANLTFVNDGAGNDITTVNTSDSLKANWSASADQHSGIIRYWYSIGTSPGNNNILAWTSNWASTSVTATGLNLTQNTIYYFNVMAENGANLYSPIISSNGQKVDTTYVASVNEKSPLDKLVNVYPNPFKNEFYISLPENESCNYKLFDLVGKQVYVSEKKKTASNNLLIDASQLLNGVYILEVEIDQQKLKYKLVKE